MGHIAVGLALKHAEPRINAGVWIFAALLCDFLLGIFAALGLEHAEGLPEYPERHYLLFTFPYSHGLAMTSVWAALAAAVAALWRRSARIALVAAVAVLSHFVLDAAVHVSGLPLAGSGSPGISLGLWRHLGWALGLEAAMLAAALMLYTRAVGGRPYGMLAFASIMGAALIGGQAGGGAAPSEHALAISWLAAPVVIGGIASRLDRRVPVPITRKT